MDGLIDENEREIMMSCLQNRLDSKNAIENNMIGEWELIGHGEGWIPSRSQPCAFLIFDDDNVRVRYHDEVIDTVYVTPWSISVLETPSNSLFILTLESQLNIGLGINRFCDTYMYGDATPVDGNMYLFQKK